jgi:hypothetical protein
MAVLELVSRLARLDDRQCPLTSLVSYLSIHVFFFCILYITKKSPREKRHRLETNNETAHAEEQWKLLKPHAENRDQDLAKGFPAS